MDEKLIYDKPRSRGAENVIKRSKQLLNVRWSPKTEFLWTSAAGEGYIYSARNGKTHVEPKEYTGMPYSSARILDKLIGLDITIDTFMSALENPASVLYTSNNSDFDEPAYNCTITNTYLAYGMVCSAFVNYSLALPLHRSTHEMDIAPEFIRVPDQSAQGLELCDALVTTRPDGRTGGHLRIVTGIARDENGRVQKVEISESVPPLPKCKWYTAEEFNATLTEPEDMYQIFRYRYVDSIDYMPARYELGDIRNPDLMLNYGDFSNYRTTEPVEFNINCDADKLIIDGTATHFEYDVSYVKPTDIYGNEYKIFTVSDLKPDHYIAYCVNGERQTLPVNFNIVETCDIKLTTSDGSEFKRVALKPVAPDGSHLTRESECLYSDGVLSEKTVTIAMSDGKRLIPTRAAVREKNGKLIMRTAAMLTDENGKIVPSFCIEDDVTLYALGAKENSVVRAEFSGAKRCAPSYMSWKEEAAISYLQAMLTPEELSSGYLETKAFRHNNDYSHFMIFCANEYGRISTVPITFVIE